MGISQIRRRVRSNNDSSLASEDLTVARLPPGLGAKGHRSLMPTLRAAHGYPEMAPARSGLERLIGS